MGARLIVEALERLDRLVPVPQPVEGVTYAEKIDKAEARIDWSRPAEEIDRRIRGLSPFPGAWCEIAGERVKLLRSAVVEDSPGGAAPGTTLDDALEVACGAGTIRVLRLQRAGKGAASALDFLRGFPIRAGTRLG
jgi:methionyl-tRNA formyltransferase